MDKSHYDMVSYEFYPSHLIQSLSLPGDDGERGDPGEVSGGVAARDPWMREASEDITAEVERVTLQRPYNT